MAKKADLEIDVNDISVKYYGCGIEKDNVVYEMFDIKYQNKSVLINCYLDNIHIHCNPNDFDKNVLNKIQYDIEDLKIKELYIIHNNIKYVLWKLSKM